MFKIKAISDYEHIANIEIVASDVESARLAMKNLMRENPSSYIRVYKGRTRVNEWSLYYHGNVTQYNS